MKFQDDISNMNTYIHTYVRTSRNQYAPPLFQSWGHKNWGGGGGGGGWVGGRQGGCEWRIEAFVKIK